MFLNHNKLVLFSLCLTLTICAAKFHDFDEYYASGSSSEESSSGESSEEIKPEEIAFTKTHCAQDVQGLRRCRASFPVYKWSIGKQKCVEAIYGGCRPTRNNFETLEECVRVAQPVCKTEFTRRDCSKPVSTGEIQCRASIQVYKWSVRENRCVPALYGGCHASPNNFITLKECRKIAAPVCYNRYYG